MIGITTLLLTITPPPEIVESQGAMVQLLVWILVAQTTIAGVIIGILWRDKLSSDKIKRQDDRENVAILNNLINHIEISGKDISRLADWLEKNKDNHEKISELRQILIQTFK